MNGYTFLAFIIGGGLGYVIFYLRYQHKDTVNQLRSHLKEASKEVHELQSELDEYTAQNSILKEEVTKLFAKNDDLTDIVTELSKYYVHIKKAAEKSTELNKFLQEPSEGMEEKIENFLPREKHDDSIKKFF
ncbi:MAG: hypothetical protein WCO66_01200 [Candidatus Absconditabacteria bacterium]